MRKLISLFFLFQMLVVSLLPKMAVVELHKSASLIQHLQDHITSGDSTNYFDALLNHYSFNCDHEDPGHSEELPFLSLVYQGLNFVAAFPLKLPVIAADVIKRNLPLLVQFALHISLEIKAEPPASRLV